MGRPGETERWALAAERSTDTGTLPDGNTIEGMVAYMRAVVARDGVARMRQDARTALDGLAPASPYRATMLHTEGVSYLLEGDPERADPVLARAISVAEASGMQPFVPVVLAERGIAALARDDPGEAAVLAERAAALMASGTFDDYWTSGLVYAWLARVALARGDVAAGREHVARAARLRHLLTYGLPVVSAQALIGMAHAYVLHVSRHTVKSQALSVYRKLAVSSRGEAIDRLYDLGLLAAASVGASAVATATAEAQAAAAAQR
jgi:LuxR family maltose regulon positive regulatory protein